LFLQANDRWLDDAKFFLESLPKLNQSTDAAGADVADTEWYDLVTVVVTMNRERTWTDDDRQQTFNLGYLTQTVARFLQARPLYVVMQAQKRASPFSYCKAKAKKLKPTFI